MSLGYADRLSHREDLGGRLGAPELSEQPRVLLAKAWELAELVRSTCALYARRGTDRFSPLGVLLLHPAVGGLGQACP